MAFIIKNRTFRKKYRPAFSKYKCTKVQLYLRPNTSIAPFFEWAIIGDTNENDNFPLIYCHCGWEKAASGIV